MLYIKNGGHRKNQLVKEKYEKVLSEICYPDFPDVTALLEALF